MQQESPNRADASGAITIGLGVANHVASRAIAVVTRSRRPDAKAKEHALRLGYHNHNSEFVKVGVGVYDSSGKYTSPFSEKLLVDAFRKAGKRLDMGKYCLHFKTLNDLELPSVAQVIGMSTPKEYLAYYTRARALPKTPPRER